MSKLHPQQFNRTRAHVGRQRWPACQACGTRAPTSLVALGASDQIARLCAFCVEQRVGLRAEGR